MPMAGELQTQAFIENCCALKVSRTKNDKVQCRSHRGGLVNAIAPSKNFNKMQKVAAMKIGSS